MADQPLSEASGPLLDVRQLSVTFPTTRGRLRALDGVNLEVVAGEVLGIVGETGSGKSVLARSVLGLLPAGALSADSRIFFEGCDLRTLPRSRLRRLLGTDMAIVFQDSMTALNPVRRIGPQLAEPLRYHRGLSRHDAMEQVAGLLRDVGIPEVGRRLRQYPHELSGGMRQRVAIAGALVCGPKLLIADEPTTALDVTVQAQILDLLSRLREERTMAVMFITHDLGVIADRADRVLVLYAGRVMETAPAAHLFERHVHPYTAGLLASRPNIDAPPHTPLRAIGGSPPDLVQPLAGCPFAPRCPSAQSRCREEQPALAPTADDGHAVACHFPLPPGTGASPTTARPVPDKQASGVPSTGAR